MSAWMSKWLGRLTVVLALALVPSVAFADAVDRLSSDDRAAIRQTIESQIAAFKADNADLAFSFATPMIQDRFGDASRFVAMVKRGYMPVYRPRQIEFSDLLDIRGKPTQRLVVVGPDNEVFSAYYMMEQQTDGSWRISACILRPIGDRSI
jgi:hypothetical protein